MPAIVHSSFYSFHLCWHLCFTGCLPSPLSPTFLRLVTNLLDTKPSTPEVYNTFTFPPALVKIQGAGRRDSCFSILPRLEFPFKCSSLSRIFPLHFDAEFIFSLTTACVFMPAHLESFPYRENASLRVFCPDFKTVVSSFETYLPDPHIVKKIPPGSQPHLPAVLSWLKAHHDYHAYLPKERLFDGHLLAPLKYHIPSRINNNGSWSADEETGQVWRSLDNKMTASIDVVGANMLVELEHFEPRKALSFGFTSQHKTERHLSLSLELSKNAIVHRLAYLTYLISLRYQWDKHLVEQEWWLRLKRRCGDSWADGIWDIVYKQCTTRDFVGVVVGKVSTSLRWLRPALRFGIPIWVLYPLKDCYNGLDGDFVMRDWLPTEKQVAESRALLSRSTPAHILPQDPPQDLEDPHPVNLPQPATSSTSVSPPTKLPLGTTWFENWKTYFDERDKGDAERRSTATETELQTWNSRAEHGKRFHQPGRTGAQVYVWESCETGGFLRVLQTRAEVGRDWESYEEEALIFNPRRNIWDYCIFMWEPAVVNGPPDDLEPEEDNAHVMEHWYIEPVQTATVLDDDPSAFDFLHRRYGFLLSEPTAPPINIPSYSSQTARRIVGLNPKDVTDPPQHLNSFIAAVIEGHIPEGHCDLSVCAPQRDLFPPSCRTRIFQSAFSSEFRALSSRDVFTLVDQTSTVLLVAHDPLSILELVRAGVPTRLGAELEYFLLNGCRFTLLYPKTHPLVSPHWNILTFPIRDAAWIPTPQDFGTYMSRLRTFFLERPYMFAAALSRGGIAWRLAVEAVGFENADDTLLTTYPRDGSSSIRIRRGEFWFHEPDEGEWFYLVGGYEILTGLWFYLRSQSILCLHKNRKGCSNNGLVVVAQG